MADNGKASATATTPGVIKTARARLDAYGLREILPGIEEEKILAAEKMLETGAFSLGGVSLSASGEWSIHLQKNLSLGAV